MGIKIEFETDNAAFQEIGYPEAEAQWVLSNITTRIRDGYRDGVIMDSNGQRIGAWSWQ